MIEEMTVHITEAELARDTHAVLSKVQQGTEVVIEQDHRPVAVIRMPQGPGRKISESIALASAYEKSLGYAPVPDPDFAKDVEDAMEVHRMGMSAAVDEPDSQLLAFGASQRRSGHSAIV